MMIHKSTMCLFAGVAGVAAVLLALVTLYAPQGNAGFAYGPDGAREISDTLATHPGPRTNSIPVRRIALNHMRQYVFSLSQRLGYVTAWLLSLLALLFVVSIILIYKGLKTSDECEGVQPARRYSK